MPELIVIAPPAAYGLAQKLAAELNALGVTAVAPDLSAQWTDDNWRDLGGAWSADTFVAFCLTDESANDSIMQNLIWRLAPLDPDKTGRFIFAFFSPDAKAREKQNTFASVHFSTKGDNAAAIADHVKIHRQAMTDFLEEAGARRRAEAERAAVLRSPSAEAPAAAKSKRGPEGIGGAAPAPRSPPGVGAASNPPLSRMDDLLREAPASAAPRPAPSMPAPAVEPPPEALKPTLPAASAPELPSMPPPAAARAPASMPAPAAPAPAPQAPASKPVWEMQENASISGSGYHSKKMRAPREPKLDKVDSMAFAPKKLRRETPELIRVAIFQPKDRARAQKAAKQADPGTQMAGVQSLGEIARGATVSAVLDARGVDAEITRQESEWRGEPVDFDFAVYPQDGPAQALITIRILVDDAQVGVITFARPIIKARKDGASSKLDSREKLKRVNRVFLSYSSNDRTSVSLIASAYDRAGVQCFFDRTSLKSGEEWSPRLRSEIERADLFHLCWSRNASGSEWVEKETAHAMTKRKKTGGKKPNITIQMLDGPPWAPHPQSLDALNFDDYARAAVVGYARGDGA